MTSCDPSDLANAARCHFACVPHGFQQAIKTSLLCQWANASPSSDNFRITDAGDFRTTDSGDFRIWTT